VRMAEDMLEHVVSVMKNQTRLRYAQHSGLHALARILFAQNGMTPVHSWFCVPRYWRKLATCHATCDCSLNPRFAATVSATVVSQVWEAVTGALHVVPAPALWILAQLGTEICTFTCVGRCTVTVMRHDRCRWLSPASQEEE